MERQERTPGAQREAKRRAGIRHDLREIRRALDQIRRELDAIRGGWLDVACQAPSDHPTPRPEERQ